jgi:hypothetical protein
MFSIDKMRFLLCQSSSNIKCQNTSRERFDIVFNNANGITALKKHVYANHCMITKIFLKEVNNLLKEPYERQPTNKKPHVNGTISSNFFVAKDYY